MENYEQKYKEALAIARVVNPGTKDYNIVTAIFPELKEKEEDERLRKTTIAFLKDFAEQGYENAVECIDWLEKQSEQVDKAEPKFKVGDWVVRGKTIAQILDIQEQYYIGLDIDGNDFTSSRFLSDDKIHLWSIQDTKDGDVLVNWNNTTFIFKAIEDETVKFHIAYNEKWDTVKTPSTKLSHLGFPEPQFEFHPATIEQRNLLFQKIEEAGYEFDFEKKKLKKIEPESTWSEKDETTLACLIGTLTWATNNNYHCSEDIPKYIRWLENLKQRLNGTE